jgi:hypothetical protein
MQDRGALKKELLEHLRRTRAMHRSRHCTQETASSIQFSSRLAVATSPYSSHSECVSRMWPVKRQIVPAQLGERVAGRHEFRIVIPNELLP